MSTIHIAKAAAVKVPVGAATGNRVAHIVRAGDIIPEGVDAEVLEKLVERRLIEKVEVADDAVEIPEGVPSDKWNHEQLDAYAKREAIEFEGATKKDDKLAAIAKAIAAKSSGQ